MKSKKIFLFPVLLTTSLLTLLTGCGSGVDKVYGKSFVYDANVIDYSAMINDMTYEELLTTNLTSIDWKRTLDSESFSEIVDSVAKAKAIIEAAANSYIENNVGSAVITFSSKEEGKMTLKTDKKTTEYTYKDYKDEYSYELTDPVNSETQIFFFEKVNYLSVNPICSIQIIQWAYIPITKNLLFSILLLPATLKKT